MTAPATATSPDKATAPAAQRNAPRGAAPASAEKLAALAQLGLGGLRHTPEAASQQRPRDVRPAAADLAPRHNRAAEGEARPPRDARPAGGDRPPRVQRQAQDAQAPGQRPRRNGPPRDAAARDATPAGQQPRPTQAPQAQQAPRAPVRTHPVLERLAALYPQLFGAVFLPLKRGIFQDLMAAHPDAFDKAELKVALGIHTRSSRYLQAVASGAPRHDLQGQPVEAMAPEHVHHALTEVFRRRQLRAAEDLSPQLRQRIARAFEASGLSADAYTERVRSRDEAANALVAAAMQDATASMAKDEALLRAQEASGQALPEFAAAHGMDPRAAQQAIARAQRRAAAVLAAQAAAAAAPAQAPSDDDTETGAAEGVQTDATSDAAPVTSAEPPLA